MLGRFLIYHLTSVAWPFLLVRTATSTPMGGHADWNIGQPPTNDDVYAKLWHNTAPWGREEVSLDSRDGAVTPRSWREVPLTEPGSSSLAPSAFSTRSMVSPNHPSSSPNSNPGPSGWSAPGSDSFHPFEESSSPVLDWHQGAGRPMHILESFNIGHSSQPSPYGQRNGAQLLRASQEKQHAGETSNPAFSGQPLRQKSALPSNSEAEDGPSLRSSPSTSPAFPSGPPREMELASLRRRYRSLASFKDDQDLLSWKMNLKKALGGGPLQIEPADTFNTRMNRVFIAQDGHAVSGYYPPVTSPDEVRSHSPEGSGHFLKEIDVRKSRRTTEIPRGKPRDRVYVYFNSHVNLDYINKEYFNDRLQFLPIKKEELTRALLTKIHSDGPQHYILPPRTRHGLPLILARHIARQFSPDMGIQSLTGHQDTAQTVSLWSPILYEGERYTMILYGIGQLDFRQHAEVQNRLRELDSGYPNSEYSAIYKLAKAAH